MYKIIRRISNSFFPRPDRPWGEDATSTAPQIGRKRRLSTAEPDDREGTPSKKHRAESELPATPGEPSSTAVAEEKETEDVKEVTKGVQEVELEDGQPKSLPAAEDEVAVGAEAAAAVPLPDSPRLHAVGSDDEEDDKDAEGEPDPEGRQEDEDVDELASSGDDEAVSVPASVAIAVPTGNDTELSPHNDAAAAAKTTS